MKRASLPNDSGLAIGVRQEGSRVHIFCPTSPVYGETPCIIVLEIDGDAVVDPAVTGTYHWQKDAGIRLNQAKIAAQRGK